MWVQVNDLDELDQLLELMGDCGVKANYGYIRQDVMYRYHRNRPVAVGLFISGFDWTYVDVIKHTPVVTMDQLCALNRQNCELSDIMNLLDS